MILRNDAQAENTLASLQDEAAGDFVATPTAADEVAFFQLSGGSTGTPKLIPRPTTTTTTASAPATRFVTSTPTRAI
ncbi:hypothetical protein E05_19410 [Plautia stali symbiont]|nr:hypothetical protein E05_19410 [Plautia stali symbiont]